MLFVRMATCLACLVLVSCAEIVGVEDWSPMPTSAADAGIAAPDAPQEGSTGSDAGTPEAEAAPPCLAGTWRCLGAMLEYCEPAGWESAQDCLTASLCKADFGRCDAPVCAPGEYACNDQRLLTCNAARDGWTMKENCKQEMVCDAAKGRCANCVAGSTLCEGAELQVCSDDGQGMQVAKTCATGEICDAVLGQCGPGPDQ